MNLNPLSWLRRSSAAPAPAQVRAVAQAAQTAVTQARSLENAAIPVSPAQLEAIFGYGPTRSGVQINESTAITFTAVFAAVRILAESVGMLPLGVFRGDDDEDVKIRAREHPAYQLLRWRPNIESTATVFKETVQANLVLWGNGYARIKHDGAGRPREIIALQSARTHAERFGGNLRYVYQPEGAGPQYFAPEEILHIPGLSLNGVTGLSPIGYAREAIALGKAAELFGAAFFGNGAQVNGVLEIPGFLKPEQQAQMREAFNAMHAGVGNAFKIFLAQGGAKYSKMGIPPEEAQFIETRKFQVTEVARIYRIPPHMLADLERSTHGNIEHASLEFLIYTLLPWLEKWEQELTTKLCGADGEYHVKFDDRRLLRTDIQSRQAFYQIGRQWGFLNADEIRAGEGLPPLPNGEGKVYYAPQNMVALDKFKDMLPGGKGTEAAGDKGTDEQGAKGQSEKEKSPIAPKAVGATRAIFEDAICRMLRKEANAAGRGKADEEFYAQHRLHVREALLPAALSLLELLELHGENDKDHAIRAIDQFAAERHAFSEPDQLLQFAAGKSIELPRAILLPSQK